MFSQYMQQNKEIKAIENGKADRNIKQENSFMNFEQDLADRLKRIDEGSEEEKLELWADYEKQFGL